MAASVNKVILVGNLGKDPELRTTSSGSSVCNFSIATTERWKNNESGNLEERTEWHNIVVWGRQAENCNQYLTKGSPVFIEGRLQTRSWEDKEGKKRYTTEIVALTVKFLGSRRDAGERSVAPVAEAYSGSAAKKVAPAPESPPDFNEDEDIPF